MDTIHVADDWSDVFENVDDFYDPKDSSSLGNDTEDVEMETMYKRGSAMKGHKGVCPVNDLGFSGADLHSSLEEGCTKECGAGSGTCGEACESLLEKGMEEFGLDFVL